MAGSDGNGFRKCPNFQKFAAVEDRVGGHEKWIGKVDDDVEKLAVETRGRLMKQDQKTQDLRDIVKANQIRLAAILAVGIPLLDRVFGHFIK